MSFWVLAAIQLGAFILGQLLKPKIKRPKGPDLEGWLAEESRPIPIVYGTQALSPNIVWWGEGQARDGSNGTYYYANMIGTLCLGPVDGLIDLQWGQKSIRLEPLTKSQSPSGTDPIVSPAFPGDGFTRSGSTPVTLDIHALQMFGGVDREGGVDGQIRFYWGTPAQAVDSLTTRSVANEAITDGTARPGVCYLVFDKLSNPNLSFYWGRLANPREVTVVLRRQPRALRDLGLNASYTDHMVGANANPAEILYDLLTSATCGAGLNPLLLDAVSFANAAATLQAEQFGLSLTVASQDEVKDLLDEVCRHIDCVLYQDLETGLFTLRMVRADYTVSALPEITVANASDFQRAEPNWRSLINEVRVTYRRWSGGIMGTTANEPMGGVDIRLQSKGRTYLQSKGRNITNVTLKAGSTTLTPVTDYTFDPGTGVFTLFATATVLGLTGQPLTVSYSSSPASMHLVEAVAPEFDLADQAITGEVRSAALDFPYVTGEVNAQRLAKRQLRALGLPLEKGSFRVNRIGHGLAPGQPVRMTYAPWSWTDFVVRITNIPDAGTLEDGTITVEWVEDVWGEDAQPALPAATGGTASNQTLTAPAMAIGCGLGGSNVRIALFPSDQTFLIRLWVADDAAGTNRTKVADFAGTTTLYDTLVDGKYYQAQLVREGWIDGPLTAWIICQPGSPVTPPSCTLPTYSVSADMQAGTVRLTGTDPQNRISLVEFRHRSGNGAFTAWTAATGTGGAYTDTVVMEAFATSRIEWRITYQSCDGSPALLEGGVDLTLPTNDPTTPPTNESLTSTPFEIAGHSAAPLLWGFPDGVPSARTALSDNLIPEDWFDLSGVASVRLTYEMPVTATTAPVGAMFGWEYKSPSTDLWTPLDVDGVGPSLGFDSASILAAAEDGVMRSPWVKVPDDAKTDARLRPVMFGGDGTGSFLLGRIALQGRAQAANLPPPEITEPPVEVPCPDTVTQDFGAYADTAALLAAWTESDPSNIADWSLATPPVALTSAKVPKLLWSGVVPAGYDTSISKTFGGFTPGAAVHVRWYQYQDIASPNGPANQWNLVHHADDMANGSGQVTVTFRWHEGATADQSGHYMLFDRLTLLESCVGGTGQGGGSTGTDPVPPPAPASGARPFGAYAIPTTGAGSWNATIKLVNPSGVPNTLASARANGMKVLLQLANSKKNWTNPDGTFSWPLYKAKIEAMAADSAANAALAAAWADGTLIGHYVVDEPEWAAPYGGQPISATDVERMFALSLEKWPYLPTYGRFDPLAYPNDIPSCGVYWAQYSTALGDVTAYFNKMIAKAQAYGKNLVIGMNVIHFHGSQGRSTTPPATPADIDQYGTILASHSFPVAFFVWEYESPWYSQVGMAEAFARLAATWKSFDP